ncbi:hypothetical protein ACS0TY_016747 [Phlomoides rotata]
MRGIADVSPFQSSLIALKPRQVLLLEQQHRNQTSMAISKPEDDSILTFSIALWLENKGFSKVLKRFLSAAQIEDDNWKAKALNLNAIFSQYQENRNSAHEVLKSQKKQEQVVETTEKNGDANVATSKEIQSKKIKKKSKGDTAVNGTGLALESVVISEKGSKSNINSNEDDSHKTSGPSHENQSTKASKESNGVPELAEDQSSKKPKEKKKKKSKLTSKSLDDEKQIEIVPEVTESKNKGSLSMSSAAELPDGETTIDKKSKKRSHETAEDGDNESKKASKKRKRMAPNENESQPAQEVSVEESKSKGLEEGKDVLQQKGETFESDQVGSEKFSAKQSDESSKNAVTNGTDNSSQRKSANKEPKSSEPKTVNAFQRVKIDEVEFVDERLQDNSYWAKDGAESGYGAKAQEVLGQVKGRGFRHEKTKKKRGSYRGGQIDLHSHSIKFNYSDEE